MDAGCRSCNADLAPLPHSNHEHDRCYVFSSFFSIFLFSVRQRRTGLLRGRSSNATDQQRMTRREALEADEGTRPSFDVESTTRGASTSRLNWDSLMGNYSSIQGNTWRPN